MWKNMSQIGSFPQVGMKTKNLWNHQLGGVLKWWYPTTMGFPTKNDPFGVFWGYHHLRKQGCSLPTSTGDFSPDLPRPWPRQICHQGCPVLLPTSTILTHKRKVPRFVRDSFCGFQPKKLQKQVAGNFWGARFKSFFSKKKLLLISCKMAKKQHCSYIFFDWWSP